LLPILFCIVGGKRLEIGRDRPKAANIGARIATETDQEVISKLKNEQKSAKDASAVNLQSSNATKIINNSLYGALASDKFLFFDKNVAAAVTATGRLALKRMIYGIPDFCNNPKNIRRAIKMFNEDPVNATCSVAYNGKPYNVFNIYSDTDSCYISFEQLVQQMEFTGCDDLVLAKLNFVKWFGDGPMQAAINHCMQLVELDTNANTLGLIKADRETVAVGAIWAAKKKYTMLVYDVEGATFYPEYYQKTQGLSFVQGSTSTDTKDRIKKFVRSLILDGDVIAHQQIKAYRKELEQLAIDDVAISLSANDFERFIDRKTFAKISVDENGRKRNPIFPNGACITHNLFVRQIGKLAEIPLLRDGTRVKVIALRMPNPTGGEFIVF
jgi:DNA polymerase elongation subunit (family B)